MRRFGGFADLEDDVREMQVRDACPTVDHGHVMFAARVKHPVEQDLDRMLDLVHLSVALGDGSVTVESLIEPDEDDDDEWATGW